jgi:hypothetical protein
MSLVNIIINHIGQRVQNNELSDDDLIQLIKIVGGDFLGLKTITQKAKELNTDYNNVKCSAMRKETLFGVKLIIDNA